MSKRASKPAIDIDTVVTLVVQACGEVTIQYARYADLETYAVYHPHGVTVFDSLEKADVFRGQTIRERVHELLAA